MNTTDREREIGPAAALWKPAAIGAACAVYAWQVARLALLLSGVRQP